jgi:hypothetical protein
VFAIPTKKKKLARLEDEYILLRETLEELIRQSLSKGLIEEKEVHLQMGCFDQGLFYWYWALEHDFLKIRYSGDIPVAHGKFGPLSLLIMNKSFQRFQSIRGKSAKQKKICGWSRPLKRFDKCSESLSFSGLQCSI